MTSSAASSPRAFTPRLSGLKIRWATIEKDLQTYLALQRAAGAQGKEDVWPEESLRYVLGSSNYRCLLAEGRLDGGPPQGLGMLVALAREGDHAVNDMTVLPQAQRRGVGAALLNCLKRLPGKSFKPLTAATVRESDLRAQLFLKALGFVCERIDKEWFPLPHPPEHGYYMVCRGPNSPRPSLTLAS